MGSEAYTYQVYKSHLVGSGYWRYNNNNNDSYNSYNNKSYNNNNTKEEPK